MNQKRKATRSQQIAQLLIQRAMIADRFAKSTGITRNEAVKILAARGWK